MATEWYYMTGGEEVGPISSPELKSLAQSGKVIRTDMVRRGDMAGWKPAGSIKGLITPDEMKVPAAAPSIRSASKVESSLSVPQISQEFDHRNGKSAGFVSVIWKWYKRYVVFICSHTWRIATSTWYAAKTIAGDQMDRLETNRLKNLLAKVQVSLGDKLYSSGFGQADIRQRIADKIQAIQNAETNKASTSNLAIEKQALFRELANAELSGHVNEPTLQDSIQVVQRAEESLLNHEKHVAVAKSNRPPIDSTRAIIGAVFCGALLVFGAVNEDNDKKKGHKDSVRQFATSSANTATNDEGPPEEKNSATAKGELNSKLTPFNMKDFRNAKSITPNMSEKYPKFGEVEFKMSRTEYHYFLLKGPTTEAELNAFGQSYCTKERTKDNLLFCMEFCLEVFDVRPNNSKQPKQNAVYAWPSVPGKPSVYIFND